MRSLSTAGLLLFAGDIVARVLGFFATIYLARIMSPEYYGMIVIGMGVLSYGFWFSDLGLTTLGTREIARPASERQFVLSEILLAKVMLSVVVFLIIQPIIFFLYPQPMLRSVVQLYSLSIFTYAIFIDWYFQGIREYIPAILAKIISGGLYLAGLYFAVRIAGDITLVPFLFFLANLVAAILLLLRRRSEDRVFPSGFQLHKYWSLLRQTSSIGIGGMFAQGVQSLPPLALGYFASTADAGVLGAVLKVIFLMLILDRVFIALFLPAVTALWASDRQRLEQTLSGIFRLVIVSSFSVATVVALFPGNLLRLIFGDAYSLGVTPLMILSWFVATTLINTPIAYTLIAIGQERAYFRSTVISGVLSILIILPLIWFWGLTGAAVAMVLSELCVVGFMYVEFRKHFSLKISRSVVVAILVSAVFIGAGQMIGTRHLWQIPIVWLIYIGLSYLLRAVTKEEIALLLRK